MMRRWLAILSILAALSPWGVPPDALQVELLDPNSGSSIPLPTGGDFDDLPSSPTVGQIYVITDAVDAKTCDAGGGDPPTVAVCVWNGSEWEAGKFSIQDTCEEGDNCGITHATAARPFIIQPGKDTIGVTAPKIEYFDNSGVLTKRCTYNNSTTTFCDPDPIFIPLSGRFAITYDDNAGGELEAGALDNSAGTLTKSGIFAVTWSAQFYISNSASTDDNTVFYVAPTARTVTSVGCKVAAGTVSTAPTFTLEDDDGNAMTITGTNPTCAAVGTDVTFAAVTAGNTLLEGEGMRFDTTNTPDGDDSFILILRGTIP